ncbi:MAG: sigma-70 family RNA polymerase sigma factor [Brumimicrobium sp.]
MTSLNNVSDELLMSSLQTGDESAFNILYDRYSDRILYYMYKMLRQDEAKAQDFTQDVFLKVVEFSDKFDTNKSFKTWIFTIAANHCKNYFRSNKQMVEINSSGATKLFQDSKEDEYDQKEFRKHLNAEVDKLSYTYKETFILRYKEDLKLKEIAEIMDCPVGTIKSRLNHVTGVLAEKLKAYEVLFNHKTK